MCDKFEITVPLPLEMVIERVEAARKPRAPRIGPCTTTIDQSEFTWKLDYPNAYALLKASGRENGTHVFVEIHGSTVFTEPLGIATVLGILLFSVLFNAFVIHAKTSWEWLSCPIFIIILISIQLLLVPFSKHVLSGYIRDTLNNDTET